LLHGVIKGKFCTCGEGSVIQLCVCVCARARARACLCPIWTLVC